MSIDHEKLRALADSLTDDQRQLLREGLSSGEAPNADQLSVALQSFDIEAVNALSSAPAPSDAMVADAGAGDAGAGDAGADAGTSTVRPEPPLTRW